MIVRYGCLPMFCFSTSFGYLYHARYLRKNTNNIIVVWNDNDLNNILGLQRFSHLNIPTQNQYLIDITNSILVGGFFDTAINVDY